MGTVFLLWYLKCSEIRYSIGCTILWIYQKITELHIWKMNFMVSEWHFHFLKNRRGNMQVTHNVKTNVDSNVGAQGNWLWASWQLEQKWRGSLSEEEDASSQEKRTFLRLRARARFPQPWSGWLSKWIVKNTNFLYFPPEIQIQTVSRTMKGMWCYHTCKLKSEPTTISWMLAEDLRLLVRDKELCSSQQY